MGKITDYEQKLLDKVIAVAGDDESRISTGIVEALKGIDKYHGRQYLWNLLKTKATAKIRSAKRRAAARPHVPPQQAKQPEFVLTS